MKKIDTIISHCDAFEKAHSDGPFQELEHKLAHKKGVTDPKALAAWIGRKELGKKEMTRRSVAGRK
mgnify:CR=1 FL=1